MEKILENPETLRVSGSVGFDFLNTDYYFGHPIEILDTPTALLHWMIGADLLTIKDLEIIRIKFSVKELEDLLQDVLKLRKRLRAFVSDFKSNNPDGPSKTDLDYLNNILRKGESHLEVGFQEIGLLKFRRVHNWNRIEEITTLIVESVIQTLMTEKFEDIKKCANPVCPLWFVDETKAHRRQWCTQAICGNRAKQAAFKARKKQTSGRGV